MYTIPNTYIIYARHIDNHALHLTARTPGFVMLRSLARSVVLLFLGYLYIVRKRTESCADKQ